MGLFMDMNKDFVIGTQNLKKAVEAQKSPKTSMQDWLDIIEKHTKIY